MESNGGGWECMGVMDELIQGMEKAKQLRFLLCLTSPSPSHPHTFLLLQRVLSSFHNALTLLKSNSSITPETDYHHHHHHHSAPSKKRKLQHSWTEQVKVNSDTGLEGPADDGYSWRKYGQKDILGAKFPRSYYRCTYRAVQNCLATKQVQRSDDDPMVFEVTYRGSHTCTHGFVLPTSPQKQQLEQLNLSVGTQNEIETVFTFPSTTCEINNHGYFVHDVVDDHQLGTYLNSPLFLSPTTSESNYFSPVNNFSAPAHCQHSECDAPEIVSTTNSPIGGVEFLTEIDPNFPFNAGFFS